MVAALVPHPECGCSAKSQSGAVPATIAELLSNNYIMIPNTLSSGLNRSTLLHKLIKWLRTPYPTTFTESAKAFRRACYGTTLTVTSGGVVFLGAGSAIPSTLYAVGLV